MHVHPFIILLFVCLFLTICESMETYSDYFWDSGKRGNLKRLDLKDDSGTTATIEEDIGEVRVGFSNSRLSLSHKLGAYIILTSPVFKYVGQTISIHVKSGLSTYLQECIYIGRMVNGSREPIPGIPYDYCDGREAANKAVNMKYSLDDDLFIRVSYRSYLYFTVTIHMHAIDKNGREWKTGKSFPGRIPMDLSATSLNMNRNFGKPLVIRQRRRPVLVYYTHGYYGQRNATLPIENLNEPFYRIGLTFIDYKEINGICIHAMNVGSYEGTTWCMDNLPKPGELYTTLPGRRYGFGLTVNGSGSKFMSFSVMVTTFYEGVCYNKLCADDAVCVPSVQVCRGGNPCGDGSDCPRPSVDRTAAENLIIFCAVVTGVGLIGDFLCYCCRKKRSSEGDTSERRRQEPDQRTTRPLRVEEPRHVPPSAPAQEMQFTQPGVPPYVPPSAPAQEMQFTQPGVPPYVPPSAPPPPATVDSNLPPSYDEVIAKPEKYGGPKS